MKYSECIYICYCLQRASQCSGLTVTIFGTMPGMASSASNCCKAARWLRPAHSVTCRMLSQHFYRKFVSTCKQMKRDTFSQLESWKSAVAVKSWDNKGTTNNSQTASTQPVFSSSQSAGRPSKVIRDASRNFWSIFYTRSALM